MSRMNKPMVVISISLWGWFFVKVGNQAPELQHTCYKLMKRMSLNCIMIKMLNFLIVSCFLGDPWGFTYELQSMTMLHFFLMCLEQCQLTRLCHCQLTCLIKWIFQVLRVFGYCFILWPRKLHFPSHFSCSSWNLTPLRISCQMNKVFKDRSKHWSS